MALNMDKSNKFVDYFSSFLLIIFLLSGCASIPKDENIIAIVDGESVVTGDLDYSLQIAHRRKLSSTKDINISDFINKLIEEKLLVQEARRMGMGDDTQINEKVDAFILRESVMRLYNEEILQKVTVSEEEIINFHKQSYPDQEIDIVRETIENNIRNKKTKERSDEYLAYLRENASYETDHDILSSINLAMSIEERKEWLKDERALITAGDEVLTVGQFMRNIRPGITDNNIKTKVINQWFDRKVVDDEALNRNYQDSTDLHDMVSRYKNKLITNAFLDRIIRPKVNISENDLIDYYESHNKDFAKPSNYKYQQITTQTIDDAKEIFNELSTGADFSWMAKTKSIDKYALKGGSVGWRLREQMTDAIRDVIDALEPGDFSQVIIDKQYFRIIRLQEKKKGQIEEFNVIRSIVQKKLFRERFKDIYSTYIDKLKEDAQIDIRNDVVDSIKSTMKKKQ